MVKNAIVVSAVIVGVGFPGSSYAELDDLTGNSYEWVSYNHSKVGTDRYANAPIDITPGSNFFTDWTLDTDNTDPDNIWSQGVKDGDKTGDLLDWNTGAVTAQVTLDFTSNQLFVGLGPFSDALVLATPAHTVFADTIGNLGADGYEASDLPGLIINDNPIEIGQGQIITFSGLTDGMLYDFVGIGQLTGGQSANYGYLQTSVVNPDGTMGTENGVQSSEMNGVGTLDVDTDDIVRYDGIDPGPDGIIEIQALIAATGFAQENFVAIDAFALGKQGDSVMSVVPEPSAFAMGILGLLGFTLFGRRRRR